MVELLQTQEQPIVLGEAIQGAFRRASADMLVQTAQPEEGEPEEGKKRKASAAFDLAGENAVLKVPLEGQALASLAEVLNLHVADTFTEVPPFPLPKFPAVSAL